REIRAAASIAVSAGSVPTISAFWPTRLDASTGSPITHGARARIFSAEANNPGRRGAPPRRRERETLLLRPERYSHERSDDGGLGFGRGVLARHVVEGSRGASASRSRARP